MSFLPTDYKSPSINHRYMKFQDGENKFRILTQPILGWEDWDNKTPVRYRFDQKPENSIVPNVPVKHFWAFVVFNYNVEQIQILFLHQANVRNAIEALSKDKEWGAPYHYDIKVTKSGKEKNTKYVVNPSPHKDVSPYVLECFQDAPCYLEALFTNGDPFAQGYSRYTPLATNLENPKPITSDVYLNRTQEDQITSLIERDENPMEAQRLLLLKAGSSSFKEIKKDKYQAALSWLLSRIEEQDKNEAVPF